jgi:biopolymer transport protein TolR
MAFGRLERTPGAQPMGDINMTPLIDVMLVLLVIFMITAPLMTSSLKLDLPKSDAGQPNDAPQFVSVALDPQGRLYFGDEVVDEATFSTRIGAAARRNPQTEVQLRADRSVPYGKVAELIGLVQKAGLSRVGFVTDPVAPGNTTAAPATSPTAATAAPAIPTTAPTAPAAAPARVPDKR